MDAPTEEPPSATSNPKGDSPPTQETPTHGDMEVDDGAVKPSEPPKSNSEPLEKKEEVVPMQADDDDAVEY